MGQTYYQRTLAAAQALTEGTPFFQFAGISGSTGISETAMTADHSGVTQAYSIIPPAGEIWNVANMVAFIRDTGNPLADVYGAGAELANGISVLHCRGGVVLGDFTMPHPVKSNGGWALHSDRLETHTFGSGDNFVVAQWSFAGTGGRPMQLNGDLGDYCAVIANDDFTFLVDHHVKFSGWKAP